MLSRRLIAFFGYVEYDCLVCRTFSKESAMSENSDMIKSLENILQDAKDPVSTKKQRVDIILTVKEIISSIEAEKKSIYFTKLSENAHIPTYGSEWAAGADLYSAYDCVVPAKGKASVGTDLQVQIPRGYYGRIAPRSGLAAKKFIDVGAGVVDSDYRGHLSIVLFNFGNEDFQVKKGDRIAQFICEKISHCEFVEVESLEKSARNADGFGSTGV
ncbi:dUTP diphosphatase domain protein [Onchocerca flexuosa]|uniref:Deoxyuridine 5'-triphosphate nucleotidohydrolase n=1 Tax=Onchocerca flexuosa TaxID=387005 RepID=A0A238BZ67_9BILA|nr:dUTP diphosphatase domain protein [Onchocerca flexuosa]